MAYLESKMSFYLTWEAVMALLLAKKINIPKRYTNFSDILSKNFAAVLSNCLNINKYVINLEPDRQLPYRPIYSLSLIKLETLKTYIKANLANRFIWPSNFPTRASIFFIWKLDKSFHLYVNYCSLNNPIIKNWYLLSLIEELFDWLKKAKQFTQLDLTSVYHCIKIKKGDK